MMDTMLDAAPAGTRLDGGPVARRGKRLNLGWRILGYLTLAGAAAGLLLPFYWMVVSSLKRNNDVFTIPIKWLPDPVVWENYLNI